ncbi:MAG TPA: S41 family peptidase [Candidatus Limnocylindrales bacterium]|nr:S41 family peptidase [Candidatus Limnocylindrales bacterium]
MKYKYCSAITVILSVTIMSGVRAIARYGGEHKYTTLTNAQVQEMLDKILVDLKENYYDPKFHGVDLDKQFEHDRQLIASAKSQDEALLYVAAAIESLNDSHTHFRPPVRPYGVDYGWMMQAIGDSACYVTHIRPDSDAAAKGLQAGDLMVSINGVPVSRENISPLVFSYRVFPQSGFHLTVRSLDGKERNLTAMAKVIQGQAMVTHNDVMAWMRANRGKAAKDRSKYHEVGRQVLFWKLPDFLMDPYEVEGIVNRARSFQAVVLDLRGNPGGFVRAEEKFVGGFFDHDVKLGDRIGRKESGPAMAKTRGGKAFGGKLIVLVDSQSASAAEIFARVVQLEKRGTVVGDRSSGHVMESKAFVHAVPLDRVNVAQYSANITVADILMADGKSLEKVGVTPDERVLPTPADLAAGRDPVLARAAALAGVTMTPEEAGKILPFEWPEEKMPEID